MNTSESPNAVETSLTQDLIYPAHYYLGGRRGLILLTVVALGVGAALNWSWLVVIGVAPLLLAFAPCAARARPLYEQSQGGDRVPRILDRPINPVCERDQRKQSPMDQSNPNHE